MEPTQESTFAADLLTAELDKVTSALTGLSGVVPSSDAVAFFHALAANPDSEMGSFLAIKGAPMDKGVNVQQIEAIAKVVCSILTPVCAVINPPA